MVKTEIFNENYIRTYSDAGFYIERDGKIYEEAIDPVNSGREYNETDIVIRHGEPEDD